MEEDILNDVFNEQVLDQLNEKEPNKGHRERFAKRLKKTSSKNSRFPIFKIAATIALFIGIYSVGTIAQPDETQLEIASFSQYFNSLIEEKTKALDQYSSKEERLVILDALAEIKELEEEEKSLYQDLQEGGDSKQIIKAMTDNYNSRIKVLDQLTQDLNELKQ